MSLYGVAMPQRDKTAIPHGYEYFSIELGVPQMGLGCHEAEFDLIYRFPIGFWLFPTKGHHHLTGHNYSIVTTHANYLIDGLLYALSATFMSGFDNKTDPTNDSLF